MNGNRTNLRMIKNKNKNTWKNKKIWTRLTKTKTKPISFHKDIIKKQPYTIKIN